MYVQGVHSHEHVHVQANNSETVDLLKQQVTDLRDEVQFLRAQLQRAEDRYDRLLQAPPPGPAAAAPEKKGWLDRLLGR